MLHERYVRLFSKVKGFDGIKMKKEDRGNSNYKCAKCLKRRLGKNEKLNKYQFWRIFINLELFSSLGLASKAAIAARKLVVSL